MHKNRGKRPKIARIDSGKDLKRWYWLKDELASHAKILGIKATGAKFDILARMAHFLDTGERVWPGDKKNPVKSQFDWHASPLTLQTVITDSYKNSQNVRRFFKAQLGGNFKFTIGFMDWIKANQGKTLADAVAEFRAQKAAANVPGYKTAIKPHNQFNQYTRDILAHCPKMSMADVRRIWELKRARSSKDGRHVFAPEDLKLGRD